MSQATPPVIIIIGGHAYYFKSAAEAAVFAAKYAETGKISEQNA